MSQSNYSLARLQNMTREDYANFFPQTRAQWLARGYLVNAEALMKEIILATKELQWPIADGRGCREVWYNPVKPILLKAVGLRAEPYSVDFEKYLSGMVKDGLLTYADLGVRDFRTLREIYEAIEKARCWKNILLFVEKDSAYIHLKPLQQLFNINIISGHGWSNTAGIEVTLNQLHASGIEDVVVFSLTDYDPFGFAIEKEFTDKCETLGLHITEHHRIGINIEHATPEKLVEQRYPIKPGRKLTVNGVSFDSNKWLAEYGINEKNEIGDKNGVKGKYGLEIEAVSAQLGGHQFLREIVATELLKYLMETDRVDEITKNLWKEAPLEAIREWLRGLDGWHTPDKEIMDPDLTDLPTKYMPHNEFDEEYDTVHDKMEEETGSVDSEIETLEEELEDLRNKKEEIEQPYRKELDTIQHQYLKSRTILAHCLYQYYLKNKDKFQRTDYNLGFPEGCLVEAVEKQQSLHDFIQQADSKEIVKDIQTMLQEGVDNGEIKELIAAIMGGPGSVTIFKVDGEA